MPKLLIVLLSILPSTCFPKNSIEHVPEGVTLPLRRICDSYDKFEEYSVQYQKYLVARDYKPGKVKNHFCDIKSISSEEARKPKNNKTFSALCKLITQYNQLIPNIKTIIKVYLPVLHSSH